MTTNLLGRDSAEVEGVIKGHREFLKDRLETEFGILDKLLARRILSKRNVLKIKNEAESFKKNEALLTYVLDPNKCKQFLQCLLDTNQVHLVNYLESDGKYDAKYGDVWPLSESDLSQIDEKQEQLNEILDTDRDLLNELCARKIINGRQLEFISSKQLSFDRNEALLDIIRRSSLNGYKTLIACLRSTNQEHVANILTVSEPSSTSLRRNEDSSRLEKADESDASSKPRIDEQADVHTNIQLRLIPGSEASCTLEWHQFALRPLNLGRCEEEFLRCRYKSPDGKVFPVFVAVVCGPPPQTFRTSGHRGLLHRGLAKSDDPANSIEFFTIHPKAWTPYEHRFILGSQIKTIHEDIEKTVGDNFIARYWTKSLVGKKITYIG